MKKNFPIKFADDLICFNVIDKKDNANTKTVGYFSIAGSHNVARKKLRKLICDDTDQNNPFKLWNHYTWLGETQKAKTRTGEIEDLMKSTEDHQERCIRELKPIMKKPIKDLIGDEDLAFWTYLHCSKRQYNLFDPDGAAIEERDYLEDVLNKYIYYKKARKISGILYFQLFQVSF